MTMVGALVAAFGVLGLEGALDFVGAFDPAGVLDLAGVLDPEAMGSSDGSYSESDCAVLGSGLDARWRT